MNISQYPILDNANINNIHEWFIPNYVVNDVRYIKSGEGMLLLVNYRNWTRVLVVGNIDVDDLTNFIGEEQVAVYYIDKTKKVTSYDLVDFIIERNCIDFHKYAMKNSINRKMSEVSIQINSNISESTYKGLFERWDKKNVRHGTLERHLKFLNNPNATTITYSKNGIVFGCQIFFNAFGETYFMTNVADKKFFKPYTPIMWYFPSTMFEKIHYLGTATFDKELFDHKMRVCNKNFVNYKCVCLQKNSSKRDTYIKKIINDLNG